MRTPKQIQSAIEVIQADVNRLLLDPADDVANVDIILYLSYLAEFGRWVLGHDTDTPSAITLYLGQSCDEPDPSPQPTEEE